MAKCAAVRSQDAQADQSPERPKDARQFDPVEFLQTAAHGRIISTHQKKKIIFSQGDVADAVIYIKKGKVKVTVISKQGKEAVVAILGADEFCGEGCLIGQPKRLATATTMTDCVIMKVNKAELLQVLQNEPAFSKMFISHILEETLVSRKTLLISSLIRPRSGLPGSSCCWPISARRDGLNQLLQRLVRKHSRK